MDNFNFRLINPLGVDQNEYINIHRQLFKSSFIDANWLEWYHNMIVTSDQRLSQTRTYGLFDDDKLIGIWSVEPKIMRIEGNKLIKVGRCFAVGISSDYRRLGLFVKLSEFAIKEERIIGEYEYILGFPQTGRSVIGGHLKSGWDEIYYNNIYSINLNNLNEKYFKKDIENVNDFMQLESFKNTINSFEETHLYKNIRYFLHPYHHYLTLKYSNSYVILKPYSKFCHILDINGEKEDLYILLESCKSICKRHGFEEINVWNSEKYFFNDVLETCGFNLGAIYALPITIIAVKINAINKLKIDNSFNFAMGVEEGY